MTSQILAITVPLAQGFTGWVLASAGVEKLVRTIFQLSNRRRKEGDTVLLRISTGALLGLVEIGVGIAVLLPRMRVPASILAAGLFLLFSVVVGRAFAIGRRGDCGCGGLLPSQEFNPLHIALTTMLAMLAIAVATSGMLGTGEFTKPVHLVLVWVPLPILLGLKVSQSLLKTHRQRLILDNLASGKA